jgi:hypothetical protein
MKSKQFRMKWWVFPSFQKPLLFSVGFLWLTHTVIMWFSLRASYVQLWKLGEQAGLALHHPYFDFVEAQRDYVSRVLWTSGLVSMSVGFVFILWMSSRLAGPFLRLNRIYRRAEKAGKVAPVQFRKGDLLPPTQDAKDEGKRAA